VRQENRSHSGRRAAYSEALLNGCVPMEKAFDHIIADYAGNKVMVNGAEHLVGECSVALLNCFNEPDELEALGDLSDDILADSVYVESSETTQDHIDVLCEDILSLLRLVKDFHPFVPFATEVQLEAVWESLSGEIIVSLRRLYHECAKIAEETGKAVQTILQRVRPDLDAERILGIVTNSNRQIANMITLYGEYGRDLMFAKNEINVLAERFRLLKKPDATHLLPIAFYALPKVATPTKVQFVKAEFEGDLEFKLANRYFFSRYLDFIFYDFYQGLGLGHYPRRCEVCGKYFLMTDSHLQRYCNGLSGIKNRAGKELTCRAVGKQRRQKELAENDPILRKYKTVCNGIRKDVSRGKITEETAEAAKRAAKDCKEKAKHNNDYANGAYFTDMNKNRFYAMVTPKDTRVA